MINEVTVLLNVSLSSFQGPADIPPLDSRHALRGPHKTRVMADSHRFCADFGQLRATSTQPFVFLTHPPAVAKGAEHNFRVLAVTFATGAALLEFYSATLLRSH